MFCEVKTRRAGGGPPFESLHPAKQAQVRKMASAYLSDVRERPSRRDLRFDAIGIVLDRSGALLRLDHLEGAF